MADPSTELLVHKERPGDPGLPIVCHRKTWVTMIGPTLSLAGLSLPEKIFNLELKEEDSITDVENTIFDLGFMDSLSKSTGAILASNPPALAKQDKSNVGLVFEATTGSPIWSLVLEPHRRLDVFGAWLHRNGVAWKRYPSPKYRSSITIHDLVDQTHLVLEELERELGKVELEKSGVD
ncbi:hypothetical protein Tco_1427838 [Tanacetum coccineum]